MKTRKLTIAILAAGKGRRLADDPSKPFPKVFVPVAGVSMGNRVVAELKQLPHSEVIALMPPVASVPRGVSPIVDGVDRYYTGGNGYLRDLLRVIELKTPGRPMLIVNVDAALISAEDIVCFLDDVAGLDADFVWPAVPKEDLWPDWVDPKNVNYLPGTNNEVARGMLMYLPGELEPDRKMLESIAKLGPLGDIAAIKFRNLLKIAATRAGIPLFGQKQIEQRLSEGLGCKAIIHQGPYPSFAFDVDLPDDLKYAEQRIAKEE